MPPALQGHTPDIAPRFDPELAREYLRRSGVDAELEVVSVPGGEIEQMVRSVCDSWQDVLGLRCMPTVLDEGEFAKVRMRLVEHGPIAPTAWFPGYPDPEYFLRLLLHSDAADNRGGWINAAFDDLIEQARRETHGATRLELFHEADRLAIADQVAVIPLAYARDVFFVKPWVQGWWEFGKSWSSFADLVVGRGFAARMRRRDPVEGDITQLEVDAIANAANDQLWMGAGVAGAIKRAGGEEIEREAMAKGPIAVGSAVATTGGRLAAGHVIHGAVMGQDLQTTPELIARTTTSCLEVADGLGARSLALPAFGTGVGAIPVAECARAMVSAIHAFEPSALERVVVAVYGDAAVAAFEAETARPDA